MFCKSARNFVIMYATLLWTPKNLRKKYKPLVVYRFYCMALFHSQTRCHIIKEFCRRHFRPFQTWNMHRCIRKFRKSAQIRKKVRTQYD